MQIGGDLDFLRYFENTAQYDCEELSLAARPTARC